MTLANFHALDFAALWASLSPDTQARIGEMALCHECAQQVAQDGGFDTSHDDRGEAECLADDVANALPEVIWAAIPGVLPDTSDDIYPCWQICDPRGERHKDVELYGRLGLWTMSYQGSETWTVGIGPTAEEIAGAQVHPRRDTGGPRWLFWTAADVDAERLRRHPEQAAPCPITEPEIPHAAAA